MAALRVAVDVGGTFTDVCVLDEDVSAMTVAKVPSTPKDPAVAVLNGIKEAGVALSDVVLLSHGTTIATNALITRSFPPAAMVTSRGFRDIIEIRNGTKDDLWDAYNDVAPPYIRRRDRFEVSERVDYSGRVLQPLSEDEARDVARILRRRGVQTVAICFINSYANDANERRMLEILTEELPGVALSTSSSVLPEIFEHDRFSTTVANAVLAPLVGGYVERLNDDLAADGYKGDLLLLHSGGGSMTPRMAQKYAARLAASGIAAGAIAARHLATQCGYDNAIGLDMGGTSTDISLIFDGELRVTKEWFVEYGYPITFPSIEVLTIGAGGGSLAWIDPAGALRNGPQSAGADPGPACYDHGGSEPTNTDANVVLGRLGDELVGGGMQLNHDLAVKAIETTIGKPLNMQLQEAAKAVIKVANANMADAVRLVSIRRGYDPREFVLVAFGGAGALHGAALATELSIPTVLIPPNPGVTSALGCLLVDIRHDLAVMYQKTTEEADAAEIEARFAELEAEANDRLATEGVSPDEMVIERTVAMRYLGQWRSLTVTVGAGVDALHDAIIRFHSDHQREHSYSRDDAPVEIYQLGLRAIGITPKPSVVTLSSGSPQLPEPAEVRPVWWDDRDEAVDTPIFDRTTLEPGVSLEGPAIVTQFDSTVVVPPGTTAEVDEWSNIRIHV